MMAAIREYSTCFVKAINNAPQILADLAPRTVTVKLRAFRYHGTSELLYCDRNTTSSTYSGGLLQYYSTVQY
jgi:hypothetical protein